jgi:endonuclease YncB( thermonuclease family)
MPLQAKLSLLATAMVVASPWAAQRTVDGDTQAGRRHLSLGIDSPEAKQACPDGRPAGSIATTRLQADCRPIDRVQEKDRGRFGRTVAICRVSGEDLGAIMVREGLAWAFTRYSVDYVDHQEEAASPTGACMRMTAWEWRSQQRTRGGSSLCRVASFGRASSSSVTT